MAALEVNY